ncbi:MAG: hypothetical protein Q4G30_09400 [Actinomycetaceae bacterium]|nr:hypothetical protein [Actinomycetaceae bacterium]
MTSSNSMPLTSTRLLRKKYPDAASWWVSAVIYEYHDLLDRQALGELQENWAYAHRLGADAVLFRPSYLDFDSPSDLNALKDAIKRAKDLGLRTVIRLRGATQPQFGPRPEPPRQGQGLEGDADQVLRRGLTAIDSGADLLDLGMFLEYSATNPYPDFEQYTKLLRDLEAGAVMRQRETPLAMAASHAYPGSMKWHLEEDWAHLLRDDRLVTTPFASDEISTRLTASCKEHENHGQASGWMVSPPYNRRPYRDEGLVETWAWNPSAARTLAMTYMAAALPGALFLRQGDELGIEESDRDACLEMATQISELITTTHRSAFESFTHLLALRKEAQIGIKAFSLVEAPAVAPQVLTLLSGSIFVAMNTGNQPFTLPEEYVPIHSSRPNTSNQVLTSRVIDPETTLWCEVRSPQTPQRLSAHAPRI